MIQTGEARNDRNTIWTDIKPLVDMGLSDLLSDTLDCPLIVSLIGDVSTSLGGQKWNNQ